MGKLLKRPVLAEGEVTGHAHVLDADVDVFELDSGLKEFTTETEVPLKHEEHKQVPIPGGDWNSGQVLEYDHFMEEAKKVRD